MGVVDADDGYSNAVIEIIVRHVGDTVSVNERVAELEKRVAELDAAARNARELVERLAVAADVPRHEVDHVVEALLQQSRSLRMTLSELGTELQTDIAVRSTRAELTSTVESLVIALRRKDDSRQQLQQIARELEVGGIATRHRARQMKLLALKAEAEVEVKRRTNDHIVVPWPTVSESAWIPWMLLLEEPEASRAHDLIGASLPALLEMLTALLASEWRDRAASAPAEPVSKADTTVATLNTTAVFEFTNEPAAQFVEASVQPFVEASVEPVVEASVQPVVQDSVQPVVEAAVAPTLDAAADPNVGPSPEVAAERVDAGVALEAALEEVDAPIIAPAIEATALATAPIDEPRAASRPVTVPVLELPADLATFEAYRAAYWRDPQGQITEVPWRSEGFTRRLIADVERAFFQGAWRYLSLHARTAEKLSIHDVPRPRDVESLLALLARPNSAAAGADPARASRLFDDSAYPRASEALRLALLLEAWRPCDDRTIDLDAVGSLVATAGYRTPAVGALLEALFRVSSEGLDGVELLRRLAAQGEPQPEQDLTVLAVQAQVKLHELHRRLWSAAGGRIQTTHSRDAWQRFMETSQDTFEILAGTRTGTQAPDLSAIDQLARRYDQLATKGGVKYGDRASMDRAANHLLDAAREVILTRRRLASDRRRNAPLSPSVALLEAAWRALPRAADRRANHDAYLDVIDVLVGLAPVVTDDALTLALSYQDFIQSPALVEVVPLVSGTGPGDLQVTRVADVVAASAILIAPFTPPLPPTATTSLAQRLRDADRSDLLIHLHPISDRDARESSGALTRMLLDAHRAIDEAEAVIQRLDEAAHAFATPMRVAVDQARVLLKRPPHDVRPDRVGDWLRRVTEVGATGVTQAIESLLARLGELAPERAAMATAALAGDRLVDAIAHVNGVAPAPSATLRATLWRPEAEARYLNPTQALHHASSQSAALRREWARGLRMDDRDTELRKAFASLVFDSLTRLDRSAIADRRTGESVVQSKLVRTWMTRQGLNPSFIPQITDFVEIAVVLPPCLPTDDAFVRQTLAAVQSRIPRIVIILTPKLTRAIRTAFRDEVRVRNASGLAVLDDIDLVRLLNPGGQQTEPLLALLEVVLEQQPRWTNINPFEAREGQHTKAEMYVGRQEEANDLATKATYSRLFSGRRLGKSALLKHVSDTHNRTRRLSSKNALRVVYVGIVGEVDERKVVGRIEQELQAQIEHKVTARSQLPAERLHELVEPFMAGHSKESLLVFLDEADMFIEAQIKAYETQREDALSWRMRSNLESKRDSMDLPRVRFVFAGYRATQRREGAWANWGDVLRLRPLDPEEGARLIAGPLARLGIDAAREASNIAFRCGYQPAVIIRFGQLLLEHLDEVVPRSARDRTIVTAAHVAHVFQNSGLQQEIRTVVWNNFQGNPFGRIVFAALLLELARVPPGAEVEDAPRKVWERLLAIAPDFLEGSSAKGAPLDRVGRELRTFVDRSLLVDVSDDRGSASYALLFPHHLPVLLQEDQELTVRQEVDAFGTGAMDEIEMVRSVLPETAIEGTVLALADGAGLGVRAAVAASQWPTLISHRAADLVERLQLETSGADPGGFHDVSAALADEILRDRSRDGGRVPLLVGGLDLLRWAIRRGTEVELATVTRLQPRQLQWWFERVRGITFDGPNPLARFVELTGGVPFLVELLDRQLQKHVGFDGSTAAIAAITAAVEGFRAGQATHVESLRDGVDRVRLERREQELLVMYSLSNRDWGGEWRSAMQDWEGFGDAHRGEVGSLRALGPVDLAALEVLARSGLLAIDSLATGSRVGERIGAIGPADPLHAIADAMIPWLSS